MLERDGDFIRRLASERNIPVYQLTKTIIREWSTWKEPEFKETLDTLYIKE